MINSIRSLIKKTIKAELLEFGQLPDQLQDSVVLDHYLQEINAAHFHPFQAGGKLIRPLLLALTAGSFGGSKGLMNSLSSAAAVECVHTYSLVHDDLPCMDNDNLRRGQPTTHVVYGDAKGLLVGDGLLTAAFSILAHSRSIPTELNHDNQNQISLSRSDLILQLIAILSENAGSKGMIWGQWLDISESEFLNKFDHQNSNEIRKIFQTIHNNKTGKLFAASFVMGFLCGVYSCQDSFDLSKIDSIKNELWKIGLDVGFVFQILDDILDVTKTTEELGKTAGKDDAQHKLTAVSIFGLEESQKYTSNLVSNIVDNLTKIMTHYSILHTTEQKEYFECLIILINEIIARKF